MEQESRLIPNRLRKYRRINGYTQMQVANILGLKSPIPVSQWENGVRNPNLEHLLALSILYHTLPAELYPEHYEEIRTLIRKKNDSV